MKPITMTVYMMVDESEHPDQWSVGEWLSDQFIDVSGWEITEGHGACAACAFDKHGEPE